MAVFILDDATGIGSDDLDALQAFVDLVVIADDDGIGLDPPAGGMQLVNYNRNENGPPQLRLDDLVNTNFSPDYGSGPQNVDIVIIPALSGFTLNDGTSLQNNGTALPPMGSGLSGAGLNTTNNCLIIYDTQQNICLARDGTGGTLDLGITNASLLYHELSHAFRIVNDNLLALGGGCNPASPEENAAIIDENDMRTQLASRLGIPIVLRDPNIHCGQVCPSGGGGGDCCIIATLATKSMHSPEVQSLRSVRDHFVRSTEIGFAFFEKFFDEYYSFSPQVCTIMAGKDTLSAQMKYGFIEPLLSFWRLMISRSQEDLDEEAMVEVFIHSHTDLTAAQETLDKLELTLKHWIEDNSIESEDESARVLIDFLKERAWHCKHIQWALVEPVKIYHKLLQLLINEYQRSMMTSVLSHELETWLTEFPMHHVWASLTEDEIEQELNYCDNILFKTESIKTKYRQKLLQKFEGISVIQRTIKRDLKIINNE